MANRVTNAERAKRREMLTRGMYVCARIKCQYAGAEQPVGQFYRDSRAVDGVGAMCYACRAARNADPEYQAAKRRRALAPGQVAKQRVRLRRSKAADIARGVAKARWTVKNAVTDGRLLPVHTRECVDCGSPARDYHHHNGYADAHLLDVVPLCRACHVVREDNPARRPGPRGEFRPPRATLLSRSVCRFGHALTPENTAIFKRRDGESYRRCRTCHRARTRENRARMKARQSAA